MKIINVLKHRIGRERRLLKKMEGQGLNGAIGTKKGDCTKVHSERTANWTYIKALEREKVWKEVGARANNNTYLK